MFLSRPNRLNAVNKRFIFLLERLTEEDSKVKIDVEKMRNKVTTTINSQMKVFDKIPEYKTVAKGARTMKDADISENAAVRNSKNSTMKRSLPKATRKHRRIRTSGHWNRHRST